MSRLFFALALALAAVPAGAVPFVQLRLAGTASNGTNVADEAAYVRLLPDAQTGFDPNDASKLFPFASTYALLAPVGERNGQPYRLSVNSLPDGSPGVLTAPVSVPVDFYTTHAGSFTVRWNGPNDLPAGWNAYLRDYTTGAVVNLRQQTVYAFTSAALTDWVSRFQLVIAPANVVAQLDLSDAPGWRLLSSPVDGLTVGALAAVNLVQGVPAGDGNAQPQYPAASPNLYTAYVGPTASPAAPVYTAAPSTGAVVEPGRGFFWLFYDAAITPGPTSAGGGTSTSRDLRGFTLFGYGTSPAADVTRAFPRTTDDFVLAGNPFAASLAVSGISAASGTLSTTVQVYDPGDAQTGATYRTLFQSNPRTGTSDAVARWQGFFATVTGLAAGAQPALTYAVAATNPTDATFYGRGAPDAVAVRLTLDGTTASGTRVADHAATVRLRDGALAGPDRDDAPKLLPPSGPTALVALVAPGGERLSVDARPPAPALVRVAFSASDAGTFTLRWADRRVPAGWTATLRDLATGSVTDLATAESYTFTSDAADWAARFELSLATTSTATEPGAAGAFALSVPSPNPASGQTRLRLDAPRPGRVVAVLLDALGRTVATLLDADVTGTAEVVVDASRLAPGTYAVRATGPDGTATQRLVVVR